MASRLILTVVVIFMVLMAQMYEAEAGSCGCPKTAKCQANCVQHGFAAGRCQGFLFFSCACLQGSSWINMSFQC